MEGQISSCKATQTDWDAPTSAGKKTNLSPAMGFFHNLLFSESMPILPKYTDYSQQRARISGLN